MTFNNIISKAFIDQSVRPFSGNDALYSSCVAEAIRFDLDLPEELEGKLLGDTDPEDDETLKALLEDGLRLSIGYFAYARAARSANVTVTKYGATTKSNSESYPADNDAQNNLYAYLRDCGSKILSRFKARHPEVFDHKMSKDDNAFTRFRVVGD